MVKKNHISVKTVLGDQKDLIKNNQKANADINFGNKKSMEIKTDLYLTDVYYTNYKISKRFFLLPWAYIKICYYWIIHFFKWTKSIWYKIKIWNSSRIAKNR